MGLRLQKSEVTKALENEHSITFTVKMRLTLLVILQVYFCGSLTFLLNVCLIPQLCSALSAITERDE